jgi:hypothetical protein
VTHDLAENITSLSSTIDIDNSMNDQISFELEPKRVLMLVSNGVPDRVQSKNQWRAMNLFEAKQVPFTIVDAMDLTQRKTREKLIEISDIKNIYPQVFIEFFDGTIGFAGTWDFLEELNDASSLPKEYLDQNPTILTWENIFCNVVHNF